MLGNEQIKMQKIVLNQLVGDNRRCELVARL